MYTTTNKSTKQLKQELDWKCSILKELLKNEEACSRYEQMSRISNRLEKEEPITFTDLRGITRYVR